MQVVSQHLFQLHLQLLENKPVQHIVVMAW